MSSQRTSAVMAMGGLAGLAYLGSEGLYTFAGFGVCKLLKLCCDFATFFRTES